MADYSYQFRLSSIPKISEKKFLYWKMHMKTCFQAYDPRLWSIVNGESISLSDDNWNELNSKAVLFFNHALDNDNFKDILELEKAKDIWDSLLFMFEGDEFEKEKKLKSLLQDFKCFKMIKNESIMDMYYRFQDILNHLRDLGKTFSDSFIKNKFVISLSDDWRLEAISLMDYIEPSHNNLDSLLSSLRLREEILMTRDREDSILNSSNWRGEEDISENPFFSSNFGNEISEDTSAGKEITGEKIDPQIPKRMKILGYKFLNIIKYALILGILIWAIFWA